MNSTTVFHALLHSSNYLTNTSCFKLKEMFHASQLAISLEYIHSYREEGAQFRRPPQKLGMENMSQVGGK